MDEQGNLRVSESKLKPGYRRGKNWPFGKDITFEKSYAVLPLSQTGRGHAWESRSKRTLSAQHPVLCEEFGSLLHSSFVVWDLWVWKDTISIRIPFSCHLFQSKHLLSLVAVFADLPTTAFWVSQVSYGWCLWCNNKPSAPNWWKRIWVHINVLYYVLYIIYYLSIVHPFSIMSLQCGHADPDYQVI